MANLNSFHVQHYKGQAALACSTCGRLAYVWPDTGRPSLHELVNMADAHHCHGPQVIVITKP